MMQTAVVDSNLLEPTCPFYTTEPKDEKDCCDLVSKLKILRNRGSCTMRNFTCTQPRILLGNQIRENEVGWHVACMGEDRKV
jgi:hypothetical protein